VISLEEECSTPIQSIKILLIDDHPPFRIGMRTLLEQNHDFQVVGDIGSGREATTFLEATAPQVIVLDCRLPDVDGPSLCAEIVRKYPETAVLGLSAYDDVSYVHGLLAAGARGYMLKNEAPASIVRAIRAVAEGHTYLSAEIALQLARFGDNVKKRHLAPTSREMEVLQLLAKGCSNPEFAANLQIAERTVAYHVENLMNKLNTGNRTETVVVAVRKGYISLLDTDG